MPGGGEDGLSNRVSRLGPGWSDDLPRLRQALERHGLSPAEWLLLTAMDDIEVGFWGLAQLEEWFVRQAPQRLQLDLTERDLWNAGGSCFKRGWLRVIDQGAIDDVQALLRDDPAVLPVPTLVQRPIEEVEFTAEGAALYRTIMAECLGDDWESDIYVEDRHYCEVHCYSQDEAGIATVFERLESENYRYRSIEGVATIRAQRVVPIGPWCAHWWERFPSGFRLELTFGVP